MNIFLKIKARQWERFFIKDAHNTAKLLRKYCKEYNPEKSCKICAINAECHAFLGVIPQLRQKIIFELMNKGDKK